MCPHHMCSCVKSATLVAIDETSIVAVDLTNVCESHDSVVLCSLVIGHMHIIKDLAGGCRSQHEVVYRRYAYVYDVSMYDPAHRSLPYAHVVTALHPVCLNLLTLDS